MNLENLTYDKDTHVLVPRYPTEEMITAKPERAGIEGQCLQSMARNADIRKYKAMVKAAPPFTSLPNHDLDLIEAALNIAQGYVRSQIVDSLHHMNEEKKCDLSDVIQAIAALKRLKGDV